MYTYHVAIELASGRVFDVICQAKNKEEASLYAEQQRKNSTLWYLHFAVTKVIVVLVR